MSLQEAASSGSFNPHVAKPSDTQRTDTPYDPPIADGDVDRVSTEPTSPFANPYDYAVSDDDVMGETGDPDMRASRRRAWTIVGLAIIIPAAVAAVIAWQLFGSNDAPVPTVTRVTTTPAEAVTQEVQVVAAEPVTSAVATSAEPAAETAAVSSTSSATASTTSVAAASDGAATQAAAAAGEAEVDPSSLTPAARLAAWTEIETIQVLPGETLWLIAQNYGTTISAIATLNGITDPELLAVGQQLQIPVGFAEEVVAAPAAASDAGETAAEGAGSTTITAASTDSPPLTEELSNWHTIAPVSIDEGDSLAAIAEANDTTVEAIMALNGIADANLIFVGDTLLVPVGYQGATPGISLTTQQTAVETSAETTTAESAAAGENEDLLESEGAGTAGDEEDQLEPE